MKKITIKIAGSYPIRFENCPSICGKAIGVEFRESNNIVATHFKGGDGFSGGGVIDIKEMKRLVKFLKIQIIKVEQYIIELQELSNHEGL